MAAHRIVFYQHIGPTYTCTVRTNKTYCKSLIQSSNLHCAAILNLLESHYFMQNYF